MDDEIVLQQIASVDVTISREEAEASAGRASAAGTAAVAAERKLIIDLIPKKNVLAMGETRIEIDVPPPGQPATVVFDVQGACEGDGEVIVRVRQGAQPLLSLRLRCRIVAQRARAPRRQDLEGAVIEPVPGPQPLHQLTIFELERGGQRLYQYILDSPTLGWKHTYESRPFSGPRDAFVHALYEDIEQRWLSHRDDFDAFQFELREAGGTLWDELFPPELQRALWDRRQSLQSILVFSEEPFVPWELVHFKEPGQPLGSETRFLGQAGLVRWQHNIGWPTEILRARPGRCRYVIPRYPHPQYQLPEAELEADFLARRFQAAPIDPRPLPVRQALAGGEGLDLIHFACHGVADSNDISRAELLLEGRVEGSQYVIERLRASTIEQSARLIGPDGSRPMVVLNACQAGRAGHKLTSIGGFSRAFLRQGAALFVGALWAVGDRPARVFTETLYDRLLAGDTLSDAAIRARTAAQAAREATWLAYTVYGNPHARLTPAEGP